MFLIRFNTQSIIEDMYNNGTIYMNYIDTFHSIEHDLKKDPYENITEIWQADQVTNITIAGRSFDIAKDTSLKMHNPNNNIHSVSHIFCFSGLYEDDNYFLGGKFLDEKLFSHGEYCIIIYDIEDFFSRLSNFFKSEKLYAEANKVIYINEKTHNGEVGPFRKFSKFEYEKEFRIGAFLQQREPFVFQLGSLKNISRIIKTSEIKNIIIKENNNYSFYFS